MDRKFRTREERVEYGRSRRTLLRRVDQNLWNAKKRKHDSLSLVLASAHGKLPHLLPIKWARMAASPFGFFRGSVGLMAADLATLPTSGIHVQMCGDAHVRNLGAYAAPDGRLVFDLNDFDETLAGPWEWDIKRLATSLVLAGREAGDSDRVCKDAVLVFVRSYRETLNELSRLTYLDLARYQVHRFLKALPVQHVLRKAERCSPFHNLEKLTVARRLGGRAFNERKPFFSRITGRVAAEVLASLKAYRETLLPERLMFVDRYKPADLAFKVVGTGSVGTRDYVILFLGNDDRDSLFLQIKEEPVTCYTQYLPQGRHEHQGRRVAEGQRRMQAQSDMFLGWTTMRGRDYLVRQLSDHKASIEPNDLQGEGLKEYATLCGEVLAKGHARSGDACVLWGYCGASEKLDSAISRFAVAYADQVEIDHEKFLAAIRRGVVKTAKVFV